MLATRHGLQASRSGLLGSIHNTRIGSKASIGLPLTIQRNSHIGSSPLYISSSTKLTVQPFPPMINPSRPQPVGFTDGTVKSIQVEGPLGSLVIPLFDFVQLKYDDPAAATATEKKEESSANEESLQRLSLSVKDESQKKQRSAWGLTRALLANAIEGVQEGHSVSLQMVGVGYRAMVEEDPFPRPDKFEEAFEKIGSNEFTKKTGLGHFVSISQRDFYKGLIQGGSSSATNTTQTVASPKKRLTLRLGYSHPVYLTIPRGITCTTPQPTKIILKGVDKDALGLFAANIRKWRPPEPYKGKGIFVNDETIKLKAARKK